MTETLIDPQCVSVARGEAVVLRDISLRLARGEHLTILGPNGCGKSTLLKTLTCELYPIPSANTRVSLLGRDRWNVEHLRRRLGLVSADPPAPALSRETGFNAVLTGFFSSTVVWPHLRVTSRMRHHVVELLRRMDAEKLRDRSVGTMSAGEQRKVMIARALAGSSAHHFLETDEAGPPSTTTGEMLLLDEPFNALDLAARRVLKHTLSQLAQSGVSILMITHDVSDILPDMRRVLLMKEGRIVDDGAVEEVLTSSSLSELFGLPVQLTELRGTFALF